MACNQNIDIGSGQPMSTDKVQKNQESQPEQMSLLKKNRRLPIPSSLPICNQSSEESNTTFEEDADSESSEVDNDDGDGSRDETSMDLLSPYNGDHKNQREVSYANLESISSSAGCENQNQTTNSSSATNTDTQKGVVVTNKKPTKPRRRVATVAQRRAANIRERRRMFNLNAAFDKLRKKVPSFAYEKRLSRIETLKLAIMYIRFMDDLVNDDAYVEKYKQLTANANSSSSTSGFLSSASYLSLYGTSHRNRDDGESCSPVQPLALGFNHHHHHQQQQHTQNYIDIGRNSSSGIQDKTVVTRRSSNKTLLNTIEQVQPTRDDRIKTVSSSNCGSTFAASYLQQLQEPCGISRDQIQHCVPGTLHSSSPGSSTSVACCSSPASSSTVTTCHSSSTIFAESPDSSPLVIANSSPVVFMNGQQQDPSKPIYHYPHLRPAHDSYSPYDVQQLQPQPHLQHESISDYYNGSGTCSQQNKLLCCDSNMDGSSGRKQSGEGGGAAAAITNSSTNGTDYSQQPSNVSEHLNFNSHNHHLQTQEHNQHHLDHRYQGRSHEDVVSHHQETHYSLHSIEAR